MSPARGTGLKALLRQDLSAAIKARDRITTATLRLVLAAVGTEEVAGKQARELSDDDVLKILAREARKRREAAEAYDAAGRTELASQERAEGEVIARYLPAQVSDAELAEIVRAGIAESGASDVRQMGAAMRVIQPKLAGRAEGGRVAAEVRRQLST